MFDDYLNKFYRQLLVYDRQLRKRNFYNLTDNFQNRLIVISVTTRCNLNCSHCLRKNIDDGKKIITDIDPLVLEKILIEAKKIGYSKISITGGEPILHPKFDEIIKKIVSNKYLFNCISNGLIFDKYKPMIREYKKYLFNFFISIDGSSSKINDTRRGCGVFGKAIEAVEYLKKEKIHTTVNYLVTPDNEYDIENMIKFAIKLKVDDLKFIAPLGDFITGASSQIDRVKLIADILKLKERYIKKINILYTTGFYSLSMVGNEEICGSLKNNIFYVDHDGALFLCCDIYNQCLLKPRVDKVGFEKAYCEVLDSAVFLKKIILFNILNKKQTSNQNRSVCDLCNENLANLWNKKDR